MSLTGNERDGAGLDSGKVWGPEGERAMCAEGAEGAEGARMRMDSFAYNRVALDNRQGAKSFGTRREGIGRYKRVRRIELTGFTTDA